MSEKRYACTDCDFEADEFHYYCPDCGAKVDANIDPSTVKHATTRSDKA